MSDSDFKTTIPQILLALLEDGLDKDVFRVFREGDPIIFPKSLLPAVVVSEPDTDYQLGPSGFDEITHEIVIQIIFDMRMDIGAPDGVATLDRTLDRIIQGRDPSTGLFLANTVMGILRKNHSLTDYSTIENTGRVQKVISVRTPLITTRESRVRITIKELQQISGRQ